MCLTIPGQIIGMQGEHATVDYGRYGMRNANTALVQVEVGDYVLVQGGFIIKTLSLGEAKETLKVWELARQLMDDKDAASF